MKKIVLTLALMLTTVFSFANTTVISTYEPIELQSNMAISETNQTVSEDVEIIYLGTYDVYVDGVYIGTYHVYLIIE